MAPRAALKTQSIALFYGLLCHGLFAAGVGMMIAQMYFGMSASFGRLAAPWSVIVNAILLAQFPLAHSFLLSKRGRGVLNRLAPAAVSADMAPTTYVIVASLQTLLLFSLWTPSGIVWWQSQGAARAVLAFLYATSWLLLGKAIRDAGIGLQTGSIGWWAVLNGRRPAYPAMPKAGLFRFCRQPIYVAFTLTLWTVPTWTPDQLIVALVLTAYCVVGPFFKEARFMRQFGSEFAAYRSSYPYWLPFAPAPGPRNDLSIYDRHAEHWWDGSVRWLRLLQNLVPARLSCFDTLTEWRGKSVLDLGCGGGFMAETLARRGAIVTGIDPAAEAIAIAKRHAAASGLDIGYRVAGGERLPLPDRSMDIVVCVDVLEHVEDLDAVLSEVRRVLRPGGLFLFDTINRTFLARAVIVHLAEGIVRLLPRGTHDPARFIRPRELAERLTALGFKVSPAIGLGPRGIDRRFDLVFGRLPTTAMLYAGSARLAD